MSRYDKTKDFWDDVFGEDRDLDVKEELSKKELESAVEWLVAGSDSIIDFGCGNGTLLLRSAYLGAEEVIGIDISDEAVRSAENRAKDNGLQNKSTFICGGIERLTEFEEDRFDAGILSNVLDNLLPEDAEELLSEFHRVIDEDGKILLKLNDYIDPEQLEEWGSEEISKNFYEEETGLYFWNLSDEDVIDLISDRFVVEKKVNVEFKEHGQVNRMYHLRNRG